MKLLLISFSILLVSSFSSAHEDKEGSLEDQRKESLQMVQEKTAALEKAKTCFTSATDKAALEKCHDELWKTCKKCDKKKCHQDKKQD